ncbi:hypothetical protein SJAV_13380 [Sulfurisphaera javensis]|uniref:Uncharacterized protein n=1 Tax=Sulfurisphaera javensis TaxID=2049879 RepID=A0AAT9GRR8_9CREN
MSSQEPQEQVLKQIADNSAGYEYVIQSYIRQYIQLEELYKYAYYTNYYSLLVEAIASKQLSEQYALRLEEEAKCLVTGNYDTYNQNKFWLYPAIAIAESIASTTNSLIDIIRQGIIVQEKDSDILYYIGGCSKYWRSGNIIVFQGGKQFGTADKQRVKVHGVGKLKANQLDIYSNSITDDLMEICIIPILPPKGFNWINPTYYSLPNANYQESVNENVLKIAIAQLLTYQPDIIYLTLTYSKNFYYTSNGHYYISLGIINFLSSVSGVFPYPYPAYYTSGVEYAGNYDPSIFLGKVYVLADSTKSSPFYSKKGILYPEKYNGLTSSLFTINKASIGSPVFTSTWAGGTSCSSYGVVGLVSGIVNYWVKIGNSVVSKAQDSSILESVPDDFDIGLYILPVIRLPTDFTRQGMLKFAAGLKQEKAVEIGLEVISKAKRAMSELISAGILSSIAFAAVVAVDEWDEVNQIVQDAKPYVEKLNKVYNEVLSQVNSCIEAQPNLPRNAKIMYEQQAQQYLNGLMNYMNAKADEDELIELLISEMDNYLESQGIEC